MCDRERSCAGATGIEQCSVRGFPLQSLGCKVDKSVNHGNGPYVFKIQDCLSHLAGSLLPEEEEQPVYTQLYIQ